jgi:hypothetical protein
MAHIANVVQHCLLRRCCWRVFAATSCPKTSLAADCSRCVALSSDCRFQFRGDSFKCGTSTELTVNGETPDDGSVPRYNETRISRTSGIASITRTELSPLCPCSFHTLSEVGVGEDDDSGWFTAQVPADESTGQALLATVQIDTTRASGETIVEGGVVDAGVTVVTLVAIPKPQLESRTGNPRWNAGPAAAVPHRVQRRPGVACRRQRNACQWVAFARSEPFPPAYVAIIVCAVLLLVLVVAACACWVRRRRQHRVPQEVSMSKATAAAAGIVDESQFRECESFVDEPLVAASAPAMSDPAVYGFGAPAPQRWRMDGASQRNCGAVQILR